MKRQDFYRYIKARLSGTETDNPGLEARMIIRFAANISDAELIISPEVTIPPDIMNTADEIILRRRKGEPLSRIMGIREFYGLSFKVSPSVLDPRPDTETLVEAAVSRYSRHPPKRILDLGTGSGCIIITLLTLWLEAQGVAVDLSLQAIEVASENAALNGVSDRLTFLQGSWYAPLINEPAFDLIVSNPPYIPGSDIANLESSVRDFDPILALDGGIDGFDSYKALFFAFKSHISLNGIGLFEIGIGQAEEVTRLAKNAGLNVTNIYKDLSGIPRVVEIRHGDK